MTRKSKITGRCIGIVLSFCSGLLSFAQAPDTLSLTLPEAEAQFLAKNYALLAQRYEVDAAQAAVRQAGLWSNPNVFLESNFYNPQTGRFFQYGPNPARDVANSQYNKGGMSVQVSQLIQLGGKRSKLVRLAESDRQLQALAFEDLLRNLRLQLSTTYAGVYYDLASYRLLRAEEEKQIALVESFRILLGQGGASPYEVTRLEAELQALRTDLSALQAQLIEEQATLRVLLGTGENTFLQPEAVPEPVAPALSVAVALDSAYTHRPDAQVAGERTENAQRTLALEKARRVPDLQAGFLFDRYGNAFTNYTGLSVAIDLPLFNRNQGNVKVAQLRLEESRKGIDAQQVAVQNEVLAAFGKLQDLTRREAEISPDYRQRLQNISTEATLNYNRKVINLLDYLDKIRTYKQAQLDLIALQKNLFEARQYVNYTTNTRFF